MKTPTWLPVHIQFTMDLTHAACHHILNYSRTANVLLGDAHANDADECESNNHDDYFSSTSSFQDSVISNDNNKLHENYDAHGLVSHNWPVDTQHLLEQNVENEQQL